MKNASTRIPNSWYQRTPFGKLKAIPAFGLLNMIVLTAEADRLTNGEFELEKFVTQAGMELVGFRKRPGSIPVAEYRPRAADGDEHPKDSAGEAT